MRCDRLVPNLNEDEDEDEDILKNSKWGSAFLF